MEILLVACIFCIAQSTEIRCTSNKQNRCWVSEVVTGTDSESLTIANVDHKNAVHEFYWKKLSNWKTFPSVIFDLFPNLKFAEMHCGIESLKADDFQHANQLDGLHLMRNKLKHIAAGTFQHLKKVDGLNLECNEITEIEENAFSGMPELLRLVLSSNRLSTLKKNIFAGAPKLQEINLNMNEISLVEDGVFDLPHLKIVYLADNLLKTLPDRLFANAPLIDHLDSSTNDLDSIPNVRHCKAREPRSRCKRVA